MNVILTILIISFSIKIALVVIYLSSVKRSTKHIGELHLQMENAKESNSNKRKRIRALMKVVKKNGLEDQCRIEDSKSL